MVTSVIKINVHGICKGLFGLRVERGGVEGSRVELAEKKLILGQFLFILLYSPLIEIDH